MPRPFPNLEPYHDSRMDPAMHSVHGAVSRAGLALPRGVEGVTVVPPDHHAQVRTMLGGLTGDSHYFPAHDQIVILGQPDLVRPDLATVDLLANAGHEQGHRGTHHRKGEDASEMVWHPFFEEGLAGLAEVSVLDQLREQGAVPLPRGVMSALSGVEGLVIPGRYRRYEDSRTPGKAHSTQGLVAASAIEAAMRATGTDSRELLRVARPGSDVAYGAIHDALRSIRPGLERQIGVYSPDTSGVLRAAKAVQDELRSQGAEIK